VGNRLPWWGAALLGIVMFAIFYWGVPAWVHAQWNVNPSRTITGDIIRQVFERRLHWIQFLGITLGLIGAFFAIKNYYLAQRLSRSSERNVEFFTRILARLLD
jgi:drug/metabolite transporter (DMT)-like permease